MLQVQTCWVGEVYRVSVSAPSFVMVRETIYCKIFEGNSMATKRSNKMFVVRFDATTYK